VISNNVISKQNMNKNIH